MGQRSTSGGGGAAAGSSGAAAGRYSSLSCDPADWELQQGKPCSGEALLLMFDRWQKLAKTFYKKGKFDISKVCMLQGDCRVDLLPVENPHPLWLRSARGT
jgi:inositol hexakisphosphate/diphosphoinositol-pentakisphosphate kinase